MQLISNNLSKQKFGKPVSPNTAAADRFVEKLLENIRFSKDSELQNYWDRFCSNQNSLEEINLVLGHSPFLANILVADPFFSRTLYSSGPEEALASIKSDFSRIDPYTASEIYLKKSLRVLRKKVALTCAVADCHAAWELTRITQTLSDFADAALSVAIKYLLLTAHKGGKFILQNTKDPELQCGFICLGMGKLGAKELNFSSDIDLIVLFDSDSKNYIGRKSKQEFFSQLTRKLVTIIEERTSDGYVFRVDLRLRPDPGSTPPALSTLAAETYYESAGQNWERAALIKARPVAGDLEAGRNFMDSLKPFIWRRNLDFAAIKDIQSIKRQINTTQGNKQRKIPGHNIKLGRGGIREIEFFTQTQQLIWGGRDPTLRSKSTCTSLRALVTSGRISSHVAEDLIMAYAKLRKIEHRLQMTNDQQTHEIPFDEIKLQKLANFSGYKSLNSFSEELGNVLELVEAHYSNLFDKTPDLAENGSLVFTGAESHPDTLQTLSNMGFKEPEKICGIVKNWHYGRYRAFRSARARELLTELIPNILDAFSNPIEPDSALLNFDDFLRVLPAGIQILSMINANPALLELLSEVMGGAPFLADRLKKYPILLDHVLAPDFFQLPPDEQSVTIEFENSLSFARDFEDVLDITRRHVNDRLFQIGILMLKGIVLPTDASKHLTNIADSALRSVYKRVAENLVKRHGAFKYRDMAVIALGKLGGKELTISSDLDLLFIYPDNIEEFSDGIEPVSQLPYFTRLAQKFISAMTAPTGQGTLYQIDLRLRPSGNAGPIVSSMRSFIDYYRSMAWTWEHMALTRARVITAEKQFLKTIEQNIKRLLTQERNQQKLLLDVAEMRSRIEKNKKSAGLWDVKHARGGLIDIEFITQYLQLKYAHSNTEVLATYTAEAIIRLSDSALLDHSHSEKLLEGLALWTQILGILRLTVGDNYDEYRFSRPIRALLTKTCGSQDFGSLKTKVLNLQRACHAIFIELIEDPVKKIRSRNL